MTRTDARADPTKPGDPTPEPAMATSRTDPDRGDAYAKFVRELIRERFAIGR